MTRFFSTLFFAFAVLFAASSQNLQFDYDAAGNCIVKYRTVVIRSMPVETEDEIVEDKIGKTEVVIFPNPTKGFLQIDFRGKAETLSVNYRLTEISGKYVTGGTTDDASLTLDMSSYASGVYLLRIEIEGKSETYKIIKE